MYSLVSAISIPLWTAVQASGNIKKYQMCVSLMILSNLPICALCIYFNIPIAYVLYPRVIINILISLWRIYYLSKMFKFSFYNFFSCVWLRVIMVLVVAIIPLFFIRYYGNCDFITTSISLIVSVLTIGFSIYTIGFDYNERAYVREIIHNKIKKIKVRL